jgi:hypothetical protein
MGKRVSATLEAQREMAWRERIARHAASKQTVEAFCRREVVPVGTFYGWRARLRARDIGGAQATPTPPARLPLPFLDLGLVNSRAASAAVRGSDDAAGHRADADIEVRVELGGGVVLHIVRH